MKRSKARVRFTLAAAVAAMLTVPALAGAEEAAPAAAKQVATKLAVEGDFAALQVGKKVFVHDSKSQLFQTNGALHDGELKDLFILPYGPAQIPMVLVKNDKTGYLVFSDLWPEFAKGKENDNKEEYMSGRIFTTAQKKVANRTNHNYAKQIGDTVYVYTANDFGDLKKGYHESYRVKGELRGLILYDCCPYVVVKGAEGGLDVYHAGEKGPALASHIEL
ncbi:hypothetical protein J19TS2_61170 [Cohnella xylanilytica]|uniref:hypothetical protein n=1 Tax=Cohnella xylanilytica TaxID=557555 RepID=UPI001B1F7B25|nr:hypothetical protein [Cohnella xylanilytica]GIO16562.1 hypothetical protein J19TS2_61170 [Cohnella xylanilytica]